METAETVINYGGAIKALGDGKIGGFLVRFSNPDQPDLYGDYFTEDTNFGSAKSSPVLWQHSFDPVIGDIEIGEVSLKKTDIGIWAEGVLQVREEYEAFLEKEFGEGGSKKFLGLLAKWIEKEKIGWSSGTLSHRVSRKAIVDETTGKTVAWKILKWPLGLDASLTPSPAEFRNTVVPIKEYTPVGLFSTRETEEPEAVKSEDVLDRPSAPAARKPLHLHVKWKTKTKKLTARSSR